MPVTAAGAAGVPARLVAQSDLRCGNGLVREHSGAYGMGVDYAYTMVHGAPERKA